MLLSSDNIQNKDFVVLILMAAVNYIAIAIVLLVIFNSAINNCKNKIDKSGIETVKKRQSKRELTITSYILTAVYLILGIVYMLWLKTSDLNDAISIVALSISIATDELSVLFENMFYKIIMHHKKEKHKN